ncbi:MAG TPA: hypothetical protein PKZ07_18565 [Sedimentisphaerales bacterium]|nr:hypothetical protein [Sedimentisphaerales bacterium]
MPNDAMVKAITEIGDWSRRNFGDQEGDGLRLGRIAPLLGIIEEYGEFWCGDAQGQYLDALGDLVIFLADYLLRSGWSAESIADLYGGYNSTDNPIDSYIFFWAVADLCKVELKRIQGIRGMIDEQAYRARQQCSVAKIVHWAALMARIHGSTLIDTFTTTWTAVRKRDWNKYPVTGTAVSATVSEND